jgi:hypothetical protein
VLNSAVNAAGQRFSLLYTAPALCGKAVWAHLGYFSTHPRNFHILHIEKSEKVLYNKMV